MKVLTTFRLRLEPLVVAHADSMFPVLSDPSLYRHLDRPPPPSLDHLRDTYARLEARRSPDGRDRWFNWILVRDGASIGFVQATVHADASAWVAYLVATAHQRQGHAAEATRAMLDHLREDHGVTRFMATVEVDNASSIALLEHVDFRRATVDEARDHALTPTELLFVRGGERASR